MDRLESGACTLIPEIADCLQECDSKGSDSNTKNGHLIPIVGHLNGTDIQPGGRLANSLSAGNAKQPDTIIAFSSKDHGADAGPISPTLRACPHDESHANGGGPPAIAFPMWKHGRFHCQRCKTNFGVNDYDSNTVTCPKCGNTAASTINDFLQDGGAIDLEKPPISFHPTQDPISSTDGSTHALGCGSKQGSASVAIALHENQRGEVTTSDTMGSLKNGGGKPGQGYPAIAFTQNQCGDVLTGGVAASLSTNSNATGRNTAKVHVGMAVRRLTPKECERLMGWPDDHTAEFSDSTRYKMCGNGVVASCSEWIARRIVRFSHHNLP